MAKNYIVYDDTSPNAKRECTMQMAALLPFADVNDLKLEEISVPEIATLETNFWLLSGTMGVLPATPREEDWGAWSAAQTGEDGKFAAAPVLTISFTDLRSSVGISFGFGADWCNDLTIQWFRGAVQIAKADFAPDASTYLCAKEVEYYDRLIITFRGMVQPHRFLKLESVSFGTTRTFSDGALNSLDIYFSGSLTGTDLEISTMNMTLKTRQAIPFLFQRQQSFNAYHGDTLVGVFYLDKAERLSADTWDVSAINAIGVLDESTYLGGVYSGMPAGTLLADILTNHVHSISSAVAEVPIYGYLPVCTRREALQQVLFAVGAVAHTAFTDRIMIEPASDEVDRVYTAQNTCIDPSVKYEIPITGVEVVEHNYLLGTERKELFSDTLPAGTHIVLFNTPAASFSVSGGTLEASGANYAKVSVETAGTVTISGVPYEDHTKSVTVTNPTVLPTDLENIPRVTNATLVTANNSATIVQRLYDYYQRRSSISADLIIATEHPGAKISLPTGYAGNLTGHVKSMDISLSSNMRAAVEVVTE